ncbi:unnamed protein product, partial [Mesorhabditis belari]|uniref:Uncharacterized protein n=1 Tax=Mesorhabditis belari TaxID=2138241 RepID=A0AAF3FBU5_9BILA
MLFKKFAETSIGNSSDGRSDKKLRQLLDEFTSRAIPLKHHVQMRKLDSAKKAMVGYGSTSSRSAEFSMDSEGGTRSTSISTTSKRRMSTDRP